MRKLAAIMFADMVGHMAMMEKVLENLGAPQH